MDYVVDLRDAKYTEIKDRPDKRLVIYGDIELVVDVNTGYFNASYTCKKLNDKKLKEIKRGFIMNKDTVGYVEKRYNYDIINDKFNESVNSDQLKLRLT